MGYLVGWGAAALALPGLEVSMTRNQAAVVSFLTAAVFVGYVFGLAKHVVESIRRYAVDVEVRSRSQEAVVRAAAVLMARNDADAIDEALARVCDALHIERVWVRENLTDQDAVEMTSLTHESSPSGKGSGAGSRWHPVRWSSHPEAHRALADASQYVWPRGAEPYGRPGPAAIIEAPIMSGGQWIGSVGFVTGPDHEWLPEEREACGAMAGMVGRFWGRLTTRERLTGRIGSLDQRLRYERALVRCSRALLNSTDDRAVEHALAALHVATGVDYASVHETFHDEDGAVWWRLLFDTAVDRDPGKLFTGPYSAAPTVFAALSAQEAVSVRQSELAGSELARYMAEGVKSELSLPILVAGRWAGSVSFGDYEIERDWAAHEVNMLGAAADMIGSYWERKRAYERMQQLLLEKDELVASVSHELRTPLTAVLGLSHELDETRDSMSGEEIDEVVGLIVDQSQEVADIVEDLLAAARLEAGTLRMRIEQVEVKQELTAVIRGFGRASSRRVTIQGDGATALADPVRMRQVVRNLVTNAFKYGGPSVRVESARHNGHVVVDVVDDGEGIPEKDWERIFDRYVSVAEASTQPSAVGIGLAVSRQLAEMMGGDLTYAYREGESVFRFRVPAAGAATSATTDTAA